MSFMTSHTERKLCTIYENTRELTFHLSEIIPGNIWNSIKCSYRSFFYRQRSSQQTFPHMHQSGFLFTRVADLATVGRACVSRRHQDLLNVGRLGQLPGQRVLPPPTSDHQHLHHHGACGNGKKNVSTLITAFTSLIKHQFNCTCTLTYSKKAPCGAAKKRWPLSPANFAMSVEDGATGAEKNMSVVVK